MQFLAEMHVDAVINILTFLDQDCKLYNMYTILIIIIKDSKTE